MEAGAKELGTIAYNHFLSVSRNRAIQIVATNLMLSTDEIEPKILAYLKVAHGFPPDQTPEQWGDYVSDLIAWAHEAGAVGIDALALPGDRATKNFFETAGLTARAILVHRSFATVLPDAETPTP